MDRFRALSSFFTAGVFVAALVGIAFAVRGRYQLAFFFELPAAGWALKDIIDTYLERD